MIKPLRCGQLTHRFFGQQHVVYLFMLISVSAFFRWDGRTWQFGSLQAVSFSSLSVLIFSSVFCIFGLVPVCFGGVCVCLLEAQGCPAGYREPMEKIREPLFFRRSIRPWPDFRYRRYSSPDGKSQVFRDQKQ